MIDNLTLKKATNLKKTKDAAYNIFKRKPNAANASTWTAANRTFTEFCVDTISGLIKEEDKLTNEEILSKVDEYKVCKQCGAEVIFKIGDKQFVSNVNFVENFPGWCFDCLLEHCTSHDCEGCNVNPKFLASNCPFAEVKNLYIREL